MMRTPLSWYILLLILCIAAPYALGVRPRDRRDWMWLAGTIAFLTWLLLGFTSVRAS